MTTATRRGGERVQRDLIGPVTNVTKWRLHCEKGRQTWEYDELGNSKREQNFIEKHALGMDTVCSNSLITSLQSMCWMDVLYKLCIMSLCSYPMQTSLAPNLSKPQNVREATRNGMIFYSKLQAEDGHWTGDYGGPLFLMAGTHMHPLMRYSMCFYATM